MMVNKKNNEDNKIKESINNSRIVILAQNQQQI